MAYMGEDIWMLYSFGGAPVMEVSAVNLGVDIAIDVGGHADVDAPIPE